MAGYSPAEIDRKSAESGMAVIALADHDTVDGIIPELEAAGLSLADGNTGR